MTPDPITKLVSVVAIGMFAGGCSREPAEATFVGRGSCVSCHAEEARLYQGSHHDLAMQEADASTVLGDFDNTTFTYGDVTTTFSTRGDDYLVRTDAPDGELHDYRVAYTFGVEPLQQYLVEFPGGRLQALGIAWDTRPREQGGQRWFHLYPDDDVDHTDLLHWTGFSQTWNLMCAECHSTNLRKNYDAAADRYQTSWSEIDVSCEACHGPASRHVEWAQSGRSRDEGDLLGLVVDLKDGDGAVWNIDQATGLATRSTPRTSNRTLEMCARCHSRRSALTDGYEYGQPLMATHQPALLTEPLYYGDGQVRDEVYVYGSFLQSRMYQEGVTCTDCHNAHTLTVSGEGNARCAGCHLPARFDAPEHHHHEPGSEGASCVGCHMPVTTYMGVDARRDHSFRVPRPDLTTTIGAPNACAACHADQSAAWAASTLAGWFGPPPPHIGEALDLVRRPDPATGPLLVAAAADESLAPIVRATVVEALGSYEGSAMRQAVQAAATSPEPLMRFAAVLALDGEPPLERLPILLPLVADPLRAVRIEAARSLAAVAPSQIPPAQSAAFEQALAEYRQAQLVHADRAESHVNLGVIDAQRGAMEAGEASFRTAIARNPFFVPAYINLVEVLRLQGRDDESGRLLADALARVPESADLHHALGLVRARQGRQAEALVSLRQAAELAPGQARYPFVLAVALNSAGRAQEALVELRRALARHPVDRDILTALATISRDTGDREAAVQYARVLVALVPGEPEPRRLLEELER